MRNIISTKNLSLLEIRDFFNLAKKIKKFEYNPSLSDKIIATLFFENSTRTLNSFKIAAIKLKANILEFNFSSSSISKGENLEDTLDILKNLGVECIIVRHNISGFANEIAKFAKFSIINAGDGCNEHPTQALLDAFTIDEYFGHISELNIGIAGDILHSRVARSNIYLFKTLGANISLIGPPTLVPDYLEKYQGLKIYNNINDIIEKLDVIMMLRIQKERMEGNFIPSFKDYARKYSLNEDLFKKMKKNAIILHPGPVNWGVEINPSLRNNERCLINKQVENGLFIRQAIIMNSFQ